MTTPLWRKALEAAGGAESAMLFGPALKSLIDELAKAEADRDEARSKAYQVDTAAEHEHQAHSALRADLALERNALVSIRAENELLKPQLARALAVVTAVRRERRVATVPPSLDAALETYDQQEATR
jgi:hypothetical protein